MQIRTVAVALTLGLFSAGCPNPNTYGVPRTTPSGKVSHSIALEGFNVGSRSAVGTIRPGSGGQVDLVYGERDSATFPHLPTYMLRVGAADRIDVGIRIVNLSALGADLKWNFLRTDPFDIAFDPGFQIAYYSFGATNTGASESFLLYNLNAPILFGINVGDVTFVPSVGAAFIGASSTISTGGRDATDATLGSQALCVRGGLGVNVRVSRGFALHPEVTLLRGFTIAEPMFITFGLGFNFGKLPRYGDEPEYDEFEDEDNVHMKRKSRGAPKPTPTTTDPNGPPIALAPTAPPPPGQCATTCDADEGVIPPDEHQRVAASLEATMRSLRSCLDRVGGDLVEPTLLLRFAPSGQPVDVRIDVGGYENLECIQPARTTPISVTSTKRMLRCVYRCTK